MPSPTMMLVQAAPSSPPAPTAPAPQAPARAPGMSESLTVAGKEFVDNLMDAWKQHPEGLAALGFGVLMLLVIFAMRLRGLAARRRAKKYGGTLDVTQLEELMLGSPPEIVDLRPAEAYHGEHGHIRGAVNIPFPELKTRMSELKTKHPRAIVLVCDTDEVAHQAAPLLRAAGHDWLYVLQGGMKAWRRAKLPLYKAHGRPTS